MVRADSLVWIGLNAVPAVIQGSDCKQRPPIPLTRALMEDLDRLEQAFKEAVGGLPNYKRVAAFEYVTALRKTIEAKDKEIARVADEANRLWHQSHPESMGR